jgi:hypothetical protein
MKLRTICGVLVVKTDGDWVAVEDSTDLGTHVELEFDGEEWLVFTDREEACDMAREYWEDMAHNDSSEFVSLVGEDTLVQWALGNYAGPGYTQVRSLEEWLDLVADTPEETFASYDGEEHEPEATPKALEFLGVSVERCENCNGDLHYEWEAKANRCHKCGAMFDGPLANSHHVVAYRRN